MKETTNYILCDRGCQNGIPAVFLPPHSPPLRPGQSSAAAEIRSAAGTQLRQGGWPEGTSQKTPALSEVFSSLASAAFYAERERGDVGIGPAGADELSI